MTKVIPFLLLPLLLSACATMNDLNNQYVKSFGNNVLSTVGLTPSKSMTDAAGATKNLVESMRDLTREEEYYLGRAVSARLLSIYPESTDWKLQGYVARVGLLVARESVRPNTFKGYHFSVLKTDDVNAFAAPGGFIFVTEGMLKILPDEDALASVLAHEVAHVALRHGEKAISDKNMNSALMTLGQIAGSMTCSEVLTQASAVFGAGVDDVVSQLLEKGYSRSQEEEADRAGYESLVKAGYKPEAALTVFTLLKAGADDDEGSWFNSHPELGDREEDLKSIKVTANKNPQKGYGKRRRRFNRYLSPLVR